MILPFRYAIESSPQTSTNARQPIPSPLIKEIFTPATISLHQFLFSRFFGVWINLSEIFSQPVLIHFHPAHCLERLLYLTNPLRNDAQHFMSLFQFFVDVCMMNYPAYRPITQSQRQRI